MQVNTLLYAMGDDTDDILRSFQLSAADQKKYSEVKGRFDQHFVKKRNVIFDFNAHHGARALSPLSPGDTVYLKERASTGTVARETAPRSYEVQTPDGTVRRKRRHMVLTDPTERDDDSQYDLLNPPTLSGDSRPDRIQQSQTTHPKEYSTRSRSGQGPEPPERFDSS